MVPDVFLVLLKVGGREGFCGWVGEAGKMAGSDPISVGLLGAGDAVQPEGCVSIEVGGALRGDLDLD